MLKAKWERSKIPIFLNLMADPRLFMRSEADLVRFEVLEPQIFASKPL
jgi:hypothetical protein